MTAIILCKQETCGRGNWVLNQQTPTLESMCTQSEHILMSPSPVVSRIQQQYWILSVSYYKLTYVY
jgi:hypothetical protein